MNANFIRSTAIFAGIAAGSLFAFANPAQAFTFQTNNFDGTNKPNSKGDIFLESVTIGDEVVTEFSFIEAAFIRHNDAYTGGNSGAASADKGDNATTGVKVEDATNEQIALNLSTANLNNIVDTEDSGNFEIDLSFGKAIDNLLIWERGMNSKLGVQALDANGNLVGNKLILDSKTWAYAGFDIDTLEIGGAQKVGSIGVSILGDLGVSGPVSSVRFFSESKFNGPDWKFVGTDAARDVPEPAAVLGLLTVGALGAVARKRG